MSGGGSGGGMVGGVANGGSASAPTADMYTAGLGNASQFGMSANAPAFTPAGMAQASVASGVRGGSLGGASLGGPSLEQESLREAAENLWAGTSSGVASGASLGSSPRFMPAVNPAPMSNVPPVNRVPSLQALEAESVRAAAAELWTQQATAAPAPSPMALGVAGPPLPSGLLAGGLGDYYSADESAHMDHILAGLRLDAS